MRHQNRKSLPHKNETYLQVSYANPGDLKPRSKLPWPVEMLPPSRLRPSERNARTHSKKQIRRIADSIERFGVINPIIADCGGRIIAGHARAEAAKLLGLKYVPVIRVAHLNETEIRAYTLADNKLAEKAGWDREILATELQELQVALPEIDLQLDITGFDPAEVDSIFADLADNLAHAADEIPDFDDTVVARNGDLFILGRHRIAVGDAGDEQIYGRLMQGETAAMAFLDPPFNVRIDGNVAGHGRIKHREFMQASGEMTPDQYIDFLKKTLGACTRHIGDGSITYVCIDWRHARELLTAGAAIYDELKNVCVWVKPAPGQGTFYRSQHELVFVYKKGTAPHLNTFELGQHGRTRTNVWNYHGANSFRVGRMDDLKMHPTVKPVALVADAMKDCSKRGSIILDAFAGSGTTIIAAEQIGRRAFCMEIDPRYVDVAVRRWQRLTRKDAVLEATGQTFEELAVLRASKSTEVMPMNRKPPQRRR